MNRFPSLLLQLALAAIVGYAGARYAINHAPQPPVPSLPAPAPVTPTLPGPPVAVPAPAAPSAGNGDGAGKALSVSFRSAVERAEPSALTVHSARTVARGPLGLGGRTLLSQGLGSGVLIDRDGYVVTNNHVVAGANELAVALPDGSLRPTRLIGVDPDSDLALLKIEAAGLTPITFGDLRSVAVGDVVLAVGNPLGVGQTVTMGIVSAKGRATGGGDSYEDFLQTDAPINQGNSGGALVNTRGELIGINSQILSPSGGNIGIGFAIPSNMAKNVMDQLVTVGAVHRGMLGVTVQGISSDLAGSLGLSGVKGALVSAVSDGGPADKAGVRRGDVIAAIDGQAVKDSNSLRNMVSRLKPGSTVALTLFRGGQERQVTARLAEMPRTAQDDSSAPTPTAARGALGLALQPGDSGLEVTSVDPSGPAADAGIRVGDVLEEVNGAPVRSSADVRSALGKSRGKPALVLVRRGEQTLSVAVPERAA
jgi:Do/DeqQ family serine protease